MRSCLIGPLLLSLTSALAVEDKTILSAMVETADGRILCTSSALGEIILREDPNADWGYAYSSGGGIHIQYRGVPQAARTAIRYAASRWEEYLVIDVPFTLRFHWEDLDQKFKAFARSKWTAGRSGSFSCPPEIERYCVPNTLANQLLGYRVMGRDNPEPEFEIHINRNLEWYYGTDGAEGWSRHDLVATTMHEIGHTLGFIPGQRTDHSTRTGRLKKMGTTTRKRILVYSGFLKDPMSGLLWGHRNPSQMLYESLTSPRLLWGDEGMKNHWGERLKTLEVNKGPVLIWTSTDGSGVSHIDEHVFPNSGAEDLMTPYQGHVSSGHRVGPVTLAMLYDMGWELQDGVLSEESDCKREVDTTERDRGTPIRRR